MRPSDTSGFGLPPTWAGIFFRRNRSKPSGKARSASTSAALIACASAASNVASHAQDRRIVVGDVEIGEFDDANAAPSCG